LSNVWSKESVSNDTYCFASYYDAINTFLPRIFCARPSRRRTTSGTQTWRRKPSLEHRDISVVIGIRRLSACSANVVPTAAGGADGLRRVAISPSRLDDSSHAVDSAAVAAGGVLSGTTVRALVLQAASVTHTHTHTHPFNGPLSGTTQVSWYQKGKTNLDFTEATDSEWQ